MSRGIGTQSLMGRPCDALNREDSSGAAPESDAPITPQIDDSTLVVSEQLLTDVTDARVMDDALGFRVQRS